MANLTAISGRSAQRDAYPCKNLYEDTAKRLRYINWNKRHLITIILTLGSINTYSCDYGLCGRTALMRLTFNLDYSWKFC